MIDRDDKQERFKAGRFVQPDREGAWIESGFVEASGERVGETAAREFRGANLDNAHKHRADALAKAAKVNSRKQARLQAELGATDILERVVSSEKIARAHWSTKLAGGLVSLLGIGLLAPLPFVVAAGIEESLMIEKVVEQPWMALLYGFAPFAAPLAMHGMRDALRTDRSKRRFDYTIYLGTLTAFGAWAWHFGPTFLVDVLSDPSAAANAGTLAEFYAYHILLEVSGASTAYCAAMHMLSCDARKVTQIGEAHRVLIDALDQETRNGIEIAEARDVVAILPDNYASAQMAYQDDAVLKSEVAEKLLAAKSSSEIANALAQLRAAFTKSKTGDDHA